jgi:flagellar FliL protein
MAKKKDNEEPQEKSEKPEEGTAEGQAEQEESGKSGGKKKLIIIIVGLLLLLGGTGAGLYFTGMLDGLLGKTDAAEEGEHAEGEESGEEHTEEKSDEHGEKDAKDAKDAKGGKDDHGKKDDKEAKGGKDDHGKEAEGEHGAAEGGSSFLEIPKMIVNLNTDGDVPRYLRLSIQLELNDPADAPAVQAVIPRVVDKFQTYLRELRVKDLRGSGGIYRLQSELLWRVNQAAAPVEVKDVLFQEILIQ